MNERKLYALPKIDLLEVKKSELKKIISTKKSYKNSESITLEHYIKIEDKDFLLGNTKVNIDSSEKFLYIDFDPFSELIDERKVIDYFIDEQKKDRIYLMNIADLIIKKSKDRELSSYRFISKVKNHDLNKESVVNELIDAEAMIKNYRGRFDIVANMQSSEYIRDTFGFSADKFFVEQVNLDPYWKETLKKMNINSGKSWYPFMKSAGFHVTESFYLYENKILKYAKNEGFL
ncbi:MAG: hypothetical protein QXK76_01875 [Candidatus Woesearchaeota archaeon]